MEWVILGVLVCIWFVSAFVRKWMENRPDIEFDNPKRGIAMRSSYTILAYVVLICVLGIAITASIMISQYIS